MLYIITYDIPSNKRRNKVAKLLEGYGKRVQLSVFECELPEKLLLELKTKLRKKVDMAEDSVRFYAISSHTLSQVEIWNGPPLAESAKSVVV